MLEVWASLIEHGDLTQHGARVAVIAHRVESAAGLIASYVHTSPAPSLGRMAALVALQTSSSSLTSEQQSEAKASTLTLL